MATTPILPLTPPTTAYPSSGTASAPSAAGFAESLAGMLGNVESSAAQANVAVGRMLEGTGDVHEAMIALQRAETTFQVTVQVRNRLVQAYQDIMRMPV
jgi:flagellar hook-basal body complex protein FliE